MRPVLRFGPPVTAGGQPPACERRTRAPRRSPSLEHSGPDRRSRIRARMRTGRRAHVSAAARERRTSPCCPQQRFRGASGLSYSNPPP